MGKRPWVVYVCNAMEESLKAARHIASDSPAATNKVLGLAKAMREAGMRCIVLSLGRGRQNGSGGWHGAIARRFDRVAMLYCAFWQRPVITHFVTAISLVFLLAGLIRRHPGLTVLVYNRAYHYVPALIVARLMRARVCLDLEDGYNGRGGLQGIKNALTRAGFNRLCADGAMVANSGLAAQLAHPSPLVCHGVAGRDDAQGQDWKASRLQVLFSGTLLEEVGSLLLLAALDILRERQPVMFDQLRFVVTGKGACTEAFRSFAARAPECLSFYEALPRSAYLEILRGSHVGLSLRLSRFDMSGTTFPSKVVEYAQHGLLVLATRASDVPALFGETALYLDDETSEALAFLLASLPERRTRLRDMAVAGRARVIDTCSPAAVGQALRRLLACALDRA